MSSRQPKPPAYRLHKHSGRAIVTFGRRDYYLGPYGSEESYREYDRLVAEWLANGRRADVAGPLAIKTLIRRYLESIEGRYKSNEPEMIKDSLNLLFNLYADRPVDTFGPLALEAVRERIVAKGHVRPQINKRVRYIVRMFKWGVSRQLVAATTWQALTAVDGIRKGTAGVKEGKKVRPVADAVVDATLPFLSRHVAAMVQVQRLTGSRPGEICRMRACDLVTGDGVWEYRPDGHKTDHLGHDRVIFVGPTAQAVLRPFLDAAPDGYIFRPADAEAERMRALRAARKSKVQPSQVDRSDPDSPRKFRERYDVMAYHRAVVRGIAMANRGRKEQGLAAIPHWHPHQLRHTAATALRKELGVEVARTVLGHASLGTTEIYAEADMDKARKAMERMG